jgi:hypothetical protein
MIFFDHISWSDETSVHCIPNKKRITQRTKASVTREPFNGQIQGGGLNVMFWGCFSKMGLGPLVVLEGSQNKETYLKLLKEYVIPKIEAARELSEEEILFMHDNALSHGDFYF